MNEIEKYINVTIVGFMTIMVIPLLLFMSLFALVGYIICKLFKLDADELLDIRDTNYEEYADYE